MLIYKENLTINLDENLEKLEKEIEQLKLLKELIVKSPVYNLLDGKTQMLDTKDRTEIRSRLGHTNNVARISKEVIGRVYDACSISEISATEIFKKNKERAELYAEVTGLAHDLGHTPFGHNGEAALNEFMQSITDKQEKAKILHNREKYFGKEYELEQGHTENFTGKLSFEHNEQSAIEFYKIIENSGENFDLIDTKKIVLGILAHSISRVKNAPDDLVAQIVRQSDKIEYRNVDFEELKPYIKFHEDEIELKKYKDLTKDERIKLVIEDIVKDALAKGKIGDKNSALEKCQKLRDKYDSIVYFLGEDGKRGLITGDNRERQQVIYRKLLDYYYTHPEKMPTKVLTYTYPIGKPGKGKRIVGYDKTKEHNEGDSLAEKVIRYVNSFTNQKCEQRYILLLKERILKGEEFGVAPITEADITRRKKIQIKEQIFKMQAADIIDGRETHTTQEYESMLREKYLKFQATEITDYAKERIKINRVLHEEENKSEMKKVNEIISAKYNQEIYFARKAEEQNNQLAPDENQL